MDNRQRNTLSTLVRNKEAKKFIALFADLHAEDGRGTSLSLNDAQKPSYGFMVSLQGYEQKIEATRFIVGSEIAEYLSDNVANARRLKAGPLFLGSWYDDTTARVYLDLSVCVASMGQATEVARKNNQRTFYDVANQRTVSVE